MNRIKIIFVLLLSATLFSCDNFVSNGPTKPNYQIFSDQISDYTGNYYTEDQLKQMYDNNNLAGVIIFRKEYRNDYTLTGNIHALEYVPWDGYENDCQAVFFNPGTYENINLNSFVVNAIQMWQYQTGYFTPYKAIEIYMGNGYNKYIIESNNAVPNTIDSVMFANELRITNFQRGDTLFIADTSGDNGYLLQWTDGAPDGKVEIELDKTDTYLDTLTHDTRTGFSFFIDNSHSYYLHNRFLYTLELDGYYDLTVTCYEPHIKNLSNGNQLIVVGMSQYTTTVYLKH